MQEEAYLRTLARYHHDIRTGNLNFDYRTGQCGPVQATQLRSWGAACPPGYCPPDNLPAALGRWFAGDRAGCRELPYTIHLTTTGAVATDTPVTVARTSPVTMCPTRIMAWTDGTHPWTVDVIQFGAQNQIVGGPIPANALAPVNFQPVPIVPDCLRAGQPYTVTATLQASAATVGDLWLVLIGPVVG